MCSVAVLCPSRNFSSLWLAQGVDAAVHDSGIFLREDAPVRLGVGKNMARSIHWCNAFKVLAEEGYPIKRLGLSNLQTLAVSF